MPSSRARLGVIFFTVLIDLIGLGIVLPILRTFALGFGALGFGFGGLILPFPFIKLIDMAISGLGLVS